MPRCRSAVGSLIIVLALMLVGCASGSKKTSVSSGASGTTSVETSTTLASADGAGNGLSKAELIAKADPICRRLNQRLRAAKDAPKSKQDLVRIATRRAAVEGSALDELSKIAVLGSIASEWQQILASRRALIENLSQIARFAQINNITDQNVAVHSAISSQRQMAATAKRIGFKDCIFIG